MKQNFKKLAVILHVLQTTQNWSFHVVVLQRTAKKCTKIYNARVQPLFSSLNLLSSDVPVAVAVVVILNSLLTDDCVLSIHILSDCATESDLKDLKNELDIMASVGHHPNLVNLIGACSREGESALKLELIILGLAGKIFRRHVYGEGK